MLNRLFMAITALLVLPALATAQDRPRAWNARPRVEAFGSIAVGHVFRFEDRGFGNHLNIGAGGEVSVWRGLRIGTEVNRTFGLTPTNAKCGAILFAPDEPMPCLGTARQGVSSVTAGSVVAAYYFGKGRVQPYLVGGISFLSATEYDVQSVVHQDYVEFREQEMHSTGAGPTFGAGLRASLNRHISIRPEIRFSDGTALSGLNLSQWRISAGVAYGW